MTREQLEHLIRAAAQIVHEDELVILGTQSVLGSWPDAPEEMRVSMVAHMYPRRSPERAEMIESSLGENSTFHRTYGYHAFGANRKTTVLPAGWEERFVAVKNENTDGATGFCLDLHDLLLSKLVGGQERQKDIDFVKVAARAGRVDFDVLRERFEVIDINPRLRPTIAARIRKVEKVAA